MEAFTFDVERLEPEELERVASELRAARFDEESVRARLGAGEVGALGPKAFPFYIHERLARREPIDVAILLFLLEHRVTREELERLFSSECRKTLEKLGVLVKDREGTSCWSAASIFPVGERLFFTDHRWHKMPWHAAPAPRDPVMYLGLDSYFLARATVRRPARAALDLCTGSGVHAILAAAAGAERAIGTDVSARAIAFAKANAMLNGAWGAAFVRGDLWAPASGEKYDLIVANPPFVPSPVRELAYRDGGPSGTEVLERIVAGVPRALAAGGFAQIVTQLGVREGESWLERVRGWLGGANVNVHALRVGEDSIEGFVLAQASGADHDAYSESVRTWAENLRAQKFVRVIGVVLTFAWNDSGPVWSREDEAPPPRRAIGDAIARVFEAKRRIRAKGALRALDRERPAVAQGLVLAERRRHSGRALEPGAHRIVFDEPTLARELDVPPIVADVLALVDGAATVPEIVARYARERSAKVEEVDEKCRAALFAMLERDIVRLDETTK